MAYSFHTGWGRVLADSIFTSRPSNGRKFIVMASSNPNWDRFNAMLPGHPEGDAISVHATITAAVGAATNNGDDAIYVAAHHSETITAAAGLVINKSGLKIIGLGDKDNRPRIDFDTAAEADINVDAGEVTFENIKFNLVSIDALTGPLDVNALNTTFKDCEFVTANATNQAVLAIVTDANAGGLKIDNCYFKGTKNAGTISAVRIVGGKDHFIKNSTFEGAYKAATGAISVTTTAASVVVENCNIRNLTAASTAAIDVLRDSSLVVVGCVLGILSGSNPIRLNEGTEYLGQGTILTGRNYYRNASTVAAGTLL